MAKLKRTKFSEEEVQVILSSATNGTSIAVLAKLLNRSEKSIQSLIDDNNQIKKIAPEPIPFVHKDPESIPEPSVLNPGYARRHFEIQDSKNPGKKRRGMAIMTEAGSEAGDEFLKADKDGLLPMSSKHKNCIARANPDE